MKIIERTDALYCRYAGQFKPQAVYLEIDPENKTVSMDWNGEIGNAIPMKVYHRRVLRYTLPFVPAIKAANDLMADVLPLAVRVVAGHNTEWDGYNMVGRLTDDATEAEQELEQLLEEAADDEDNAQVVWDWEYCYEGCRDVMRADATDDEIDACVAEIEEMAKCEGAVIDCDLSAKLYEIRNDKRDEE